MLEIKVTQYRNTKDMLDDYRLGVIEGVKRAIFYAEGQAKKSFNKHGKLKVRTGHLRRSITSTVIQNGTVFTGSLFNNLIYAPVHEYGATIVPVRKKYLAFKIGDNWIRKKKSVIPARPFLRPAFTDNLTDIVDIILAAINERVGK